MNKLATIFSDKKTIIPFITCGDPDLATTADCIRSAVRAGAPLVELAIPFSDPTAEGPILQESYNRALNAGTTTDAVFDMLLNIQKELGVPVALMTYANVVFSYGSERFFSRCKQCNVLAILLPDIPYEEKEEFLADCKKNDVALISFVAPASKERISRIVGEADGFLYTTPSMLPAIREISSLPCLVNGDSAAESGDTALLSEANGIIYDVSFTKVLADFPADAPEKIAALIKEKQAL